MEKLDLFWRHSNCPLRFKLTAMDAVLKSKLLYGLETAQLNPSDIQKLDTFQLKGLRKILKITTTYVNRANTNEYVFEKANQELRNEDHANAIIKFSESYLKRKLLLFQKIVALPNSDPLRQTTFIPDSIKPVIYGTRRVGRPKIRWAIDAAELYWKKINALLPYDEQGRPLNIHSPTQGQIIITAAKNNVFPLR